MTPRHSGRLLLTILMMVCVGGCYDRWTGNYDKLAELDDSEALMGSAELSDADRQARRELLEEVAKSEAPTYTINGGDKIELKVYNHPDLSVKTVVTPDGYIGLMLAGEVKIAGLTLKQASQKIADALSKYIRNPQVGLSPYEIVSENATIAGAVTYAGIYPITDGMRLADLFAKAGGAATRHFDGHTISAADFPNSVLIRNNTIIPVDFSAAIERGDPLHNVRLHRGDYVYISALENSQVYLIGEVKRPGGHIWTRQLGLLELLAEGGWLEETNWKHVIIIRGGLANPKMYKVDMDGILRGEHPNVALRSGDIVYVPRDNISEYNVFIRKLMPTAELINMMITPAAWVGKPF